MLSLLLVPPDAKVIIFSAPTPVSVRESVHLSKLVFGQSCNSSKVAFVTQPESGRTKVKVLWVKIIRFMSGLRRLLSINAALLPKGQYKVQR